MGRRMKSKFKYRPKKENKSSATIASSSASPPPWIELPEDITANILKRLGSEEILKSSQKVCTTWRKVCNDPSIWRVIELINPRFLVKQYDLMCRLAVDRSQGQLVDLSVNNFGDDELINYAADRSSLLKRLTLQNCIDISGEGLVEAVKKLPHLEELHLNFIEEVPASDIETIGISCPMLKSFSFNGRVSCHRILGNEFTGNNSEYALAIAKSMPNLCHLNVLFANWLKNDGLEAILDGCPHLESLDLRQCFCLNMKQGTLGKRCSEQIKHMKYPSDSISDINWIIDDPYDDLYSTQISDYDCYADFGYFDDYDDYTNPFNDVSFLDDDELWIFGHDIF